MARVMNNRADDVRLLKMLDLIAHEGLSRQAVADRLGVGRNSVIGQVQRVTQAGRDFAALCEARGEPECQCRKPENRDGGMPRRWWAA